MLARHELQALEEVNKKMPSRYSTEQDLGFLEHIETVTQSLKLAFVSLPEL